MSIEGIANLFQNLPGQMPGQTQEIRVGKGAPGIENAGNTAVAEDFFTPSTQNPLASTTAQDAGIFQLGRGAVGALTANILFPRTSSNTNQGGAALNTVPEATTNPGTPQTGSAANSDSAENTGQPSTNSPAAQAMIATAAAANAQLQIQSLNASLPTLGLTNNQINEIDRIASLVQNFNPAAYANLVSQFEALAQQATPSNSVGLPVIPGTGGATNLGTSANANGFQVQEIPVKFIGSQKSAADNSSGSGGGQGSATNNGQTAAPGLQIVQVQFTFSNGNGQTIQVHTPQQNSNT